MIEITYADIEKACEGLKVTPIERYNKKTGKKDTKDYVDVAQRVKAFRRLYPQGFIKTDFVRLEGGFCVMRATAGFYNDEGTAVLIATGTAQESQDANMINKTSYIENCETSAIGRALGMAGIGIDGGIASADEMQNALKQQEQLENTKGAKSNKQSKSDEEPDLHTTIEDAPKAVSKVKGMIATLEEMGATAFMDELKQMYGIEKVEDIKKGDYNTIMQLGQSKYEMLKEAE